PPVPSLFPYTTLFRSTCRSYLSTMALSFATRSGHSQLYCTTTPPSSRLCTCSSRTIGRVCTPQGAMYGRCGPEVGGSELYCTWGDRKSTRLNSSHVAI